MTQWPDKNSDIQDVLVLLSGGLDSVTALYYADREYARVTAASFDYGSRHNANEIALARRHCTLLDIDHTVMPLGFISEHFRSHLLIEGGAIPDGHYEEESMKQTVVPFRNGIMLAVAVGFAESIGAEGVLIAAHTGDHAVYPDCRESFMRAMAEAMATGTYAGVTLLRPFIALTKADIVSLGQAMHIDYATTWSCYKGGTQHCGVCGTCTERREAFLLAGVPDPTIYLATPPLPAAPGKKQ